MIFSITIQLVAGNAFSHPALPKPSTTKPKTFLEVVGENVYTELMYCNPSVFGDPLYPKNAKAYLHKDALTALQVAALLAKARGYEIVVLDAYRPFSTTITMWNHAVRNKMNLNLVAPPWLGSDHNRGIAVDVTIRKRGRCSIQQPADSLEWHMCPEITTLREIMISAGFEPYYKEWWHYALPNKESFHLYNFKL